MTGTSMKEAHLACQIQHLWQVLQCEAQVWMGIGDLERKDASPTTDAAELRSRGAVLSKDKLHMRCVKLSAGTLKNAYVGH